MICINSSFLDVRILLKHAADLRGKVEFIYILHTSITHIRHMQMENPIYSMACNGGFKYEVQHR